MILGTPPESTLVKIGSQRAQNYVRSLPFMKKISYRHLFPNANPLALDLLEKMLALDPHERISVNEALEHPYLEVWHDPRDEPECQVKFDFKTFETFEELDEMKQLIMEEVRTFRDFVRKPIEEQQQIQLQMQIQQREKQELEEQQRQNRSLDVSSSSNIREDDYPKPQELNDFSFQSLESNNYQYDSGDANMSGINLNDFPNTLGPDYYKLEEELGFGLDGNAFDNFNQ